VKRALRILAVLTGLVLALVGTMAVAAWLSSGSASATATATSVDKANQPTATRGPGQVSLGWTASTLANGAPVGGYEVLRHDQSTTTVVCTAISPAHGCTDPAPVGHAVTYGVVATVGAHWRGAESATTSFTYDTVAPNTTASVSPVANGTGWNRTSVTVTLSASDPAIGSGVDHITYAVDAGSPVTVAGSSASVPVSGTGTHAVTFFAVDGSGNTEATNSITIRIDPDAPLITNLKPATGATGTWATINCGNGDRVCADVSDATSGLSTGSVTFSLTGTSGTNSGKCWNGSSFVAPSCAGQPMSVVSGSQYGSSTSLTAALMGAGNYTMVVTATDVAGNVSTATSTFTVKLDQTISFTSAAPGNATVGGATYPVSATATSGLAVTFTSATTSVCTVSGSTVTFVAAGTCTINADQAGNSTFNAAPQVQQSFAVKANQTITFNALSGRTFGDSPFTVSATASSGLSVAFTSATTPVCTVSGSTVSLVAAGTCTINADQAGDATYNAAPQVQQSFSVAKANQAITFTQPSTPAAANTSATLSATATSNLAVTFSTSSPAAVCTVSGITVTYVGAGTCTISADQAGNADYNAAPPVQRSVTVTAAFAITGRSLASPQNTTTISGTGGTSGATVSVYVCNGSQTSCGAGSPNLVVSTFFTQPQTTTAAANGTWSVTFSKLAGGPGNFTAQAFQGSPSKTSAVFVFTTS
jgi:hypothetical protein